VTYAVDGLNWTLSIADNGVGKTANSDVFQTKGGLGTSIVQALAQQLAARIEITTGASGTTLALHHTETQMVPQAA
jgi:chemotaxis protein methyltransferase CheR